MYKSEELAKNNELAVRVFEEINEVVGNGFRESRHDLKVAIDSMVKDAISPFERNQWSTVEDVVFHVLDSQAFMLWPASVYKHHHWVTGLAAHTREVMMLSGEILKKSIMARKSILGPEDFQELTVAAFGALYHDFGKVWDYKVDFGHVEGNQLGIQDSFPRNPDLKSVLAWIDDKKVVTYSNHADEVHHIARGMQVWNTAAEATDIEDYLRIPDLVRRVEHVIMSHHQLKEWGSPVSPRSPAAWAVHLADMASVNVVEQAYLKRKEK